MSVDAPACRLPRFHAGRAAEPLYTRASVRQVSGSVPLLANGLC